MLSMHKMKKILDTTRSSVPENDFKILDSWTEAEEGTPSRDAKLKYLCYKIETIDPETGDKNVLYKAVKFARVLRLPKSAKQSTSFMDMQTQVLSAVYEQGYNLVTVIANVIRPTAEGLMYLYGVQGVADNIEEAKKRASSDFSGFIGSMMGTFRVLHIRTVTVEEGAWLSEKMRNMKFMTAVRGIPKANTEGEDMGNKGVGGTNLNPDSQGTLEELITAMADHEYVIEVLSTPVYMRTLMSWSSQTQKQMTEWYGQLQGTKSLSFNLSIPMTYMTSTGSSQGWSKNYTDSRNVSYTQGESYNTGYSENVGSSIQQSLGQSFGLSKGHSLTDSVGQNTSVSNGVTRGHTVGETNGITQGQTYGETVGHTMGVTRGYTQGVTKGTSTGFTIGESQGNNFGRSVGENLSESTNKSFSSGTSLSQSFGQSTGKGSSENFGQSSNTSSGKSSNTSFGESSNTSFGRSSNTSIGESSNTSFGRSSNTSIGESSNRSIGESSNRSFGESSNTSFGESSNTSYGESSNTSYGESSNTSYGESSNRSIGESSNVSYGESSNQSFGQSQNVSHSLGTSENSSFSAGENHSTSTSDSISGSQGGSHSTSYNNGGSTSWSNGTSSNLGFSSNSSDTEGNSGGVNGSVFGVGGNMGEQHSSSTGTGTSYGMGQSSSNGGGTSWSDGYSDGTSWSNSASHGTSNSDGYSTSESHGYGTSESFSSGQGQSYSEGYGQSYSEGHGQSYSEGYGQSYSEGHGQSYSEGYGQSYSEGHGQSYSEGHGQSYSEGYGQSYSEGHGQSYSEGYGQSYSEGYGQSYSEGQGRSYSSGYGNSYSEGFGNSYSRGENLSYSNSNSNSSGQTSGVSDGYGSNKGTSSSQNTGQSYSLSISKNQGTSFSSSMSQSVSQSESVSSSQSSSTSRSNSYSQSTSDSSSTSQSVSNGQSKSRSVGESDSQSYTQSLSNGLGKSWGQSTSVGKGQSYGTSEGESKGTSMGSTGSFTTGTSGSMGLGPSIGYSKSYQWMDQQVKDILELLEYQNERLKKALRGNGAFYTYVYIACDNMDALATAQAAAKSTWQNTYAMTQPIQVLDLTDEEQQHLLYHFRAFSADVTRENVAGVNDYKYATVLLPDEYVAYTHLPRVSEGGIDTNVDDIPKFRVPGLLRGNIYMGTQLNAERYTFMNGYRTQFDYRLNIDELMHGICTGQSRSGKTVAAMRFVRELANARRTATNKRLRIVIMDPKQDWRGIARFVEPERFRFYSMGNTHFHPINLNPCKIPYGVEPQHWIDGIINIYCRAYGLLERGKQMLSDVFYDLYNEQKIFDENEANKFGGPESSEWKAEVSRRSGSVTFHKVYKKMEQIQGSFNGKDKKAGNDTLDAYSRLLERLSCFARPYSIEYRLFSAETNFSDPNSKGLGMGVDELIGGDDVTVFESFGLESTFANFIFGIITSGFYKVAKSYERGYLNPAQYETVLVIEEANKVLTGNDTAGTGGQQSVSLSGQSEFEEILDQSAGYGLFIFAITQKPSMMPSSIIANCGLLFMGRLTQPEDVNLGVRMIGREERIEDRDIVKWLPKSPTGWFICRSSRGYNFLDAEPVLVQIEPLNNATISNAELNEILVRKKIAEVVKKSDLKFA